MGIQGKSLFSGQVIAGNSKSAFNSFALVYLSPPVISSVVILKPSPPISWLQRSLVECPSVTTCVCPLVFFHHCNKCETILRCMMLYFHHRWLSARLMHFKVLMTQWAKYLLRPVHPMEVFSTLEAPLEALTNKVETVNWPQVAQILRSPFKSARCSSTGPGCSQSWWSIPLLGSKVWWSVVFWRAASYNQQRRFSSASNSIVVAKDVKISADSYSSSYCTEILWLMVSAYFSEGLWIPSFTNNC